MIHRDATFAFGWRDKPIWKLWHYWMPVNYQYFRYNKEIKKDVVYYYERKYFFQKALLIRDIKTVFDITWVKTLFTYGTVSALAFFGYFNSEMWLVLFLPIARDADTGGRQTGASPLNITHVVTGSNPYLAVGLSHQGGDNVTTVKYNAISATVVDKINYAGTFFVYGYSLAAPSTGSNTLEVAYTGTGNFVGAVGASYTGVAQTSPVNGTDTSSTASATELTSTVTTTVDNSWTFLSHRDDSGEAETAGAGSSFVGETDVNREHSVWDSNGVVTPAGAKSMTITHNATTAAGQVMWGFAPVTAIRHNLMPLMGVG